MEYGVSEFMANYDDDRPRRFERGGGNYRPYGGGGNSGGGPRRSFAPVKEGEEIDVTIEAIAAKGDGIAKRQGFVIFVPSSKVGDNLKIRITKVLQRVAFSEIIGKSDGKSAPQESAPAEIEESEPADEGSVEDTENFGDDEQEQQ